MKIAITIGHSKLKNGSYTSSCGIKNEYLYCKEQGKALKAFLEQKGHQVVLIQCPEGVFAKPSEEKNYKLSRINGKGFDLVIELHLNCFNKTAKGAEVLYLSNKSKEFAERVVKKLATKFVNRGAKYRNDLYILKSTDCKAILIESFFCDNKIDCDIADSLGYAGIAKLIGEGVINKTTSNIIKNYAILYSNEADKVGAEILSWGIPNSTVLDIKDFKNNYWGVICVGGKTETELKARYSGINYTVVKGDDRYDTVNKCMKYLNK